MDTPKPQERPSKEEYYFNIALAVAMRSTCLRRKYGAVIVKDDHIISTGYNGSARGERYELCQAVHAEANAILNADPADMIGATLYLAGWENGKIIPRPVPCAMCARLIRNARIGKVVTCRYKKEHYLH